MLNINGIEWGVFLCSPYDPILRKSNGEYAIGVCDNYDKIICISDDLTKEELYTVLKHEMVHCFLCSYGYNLNNYCHEELIAQFVEQYGEELIDVTRYAYNIIIKGRY